MVVNCIDKKTFELIENEHALGKITYKSVFSYHAQIDIPDDATYHLKPKGFFWMKMSVIQNDREIGDLSMNWKGQIIINYRNKKYTFKSTSMLQTKYELADAANQRIAIINQNYEWKKFRYSYDVVPGKVNVDPILILLSIYAANYYVAAMSGVS